MARWLTTGAGVVGRVAVANGERPATSERLQRSAGAVRAEVKGSQQAPVVGVVLQGDGVAAPRDRAGAAERHAIAVGEQVFAGRRIELQAIAVAVVLQAMLE